jgi:hypothetical protein
MKCKIWISSFWSPYLLPIYFSILGPHILFSTLFPNILNGLPNQLETPPPKKRNTFVDTSNFKWERTPKLETHRLKSLYVGGLKPHARNTCDTELISEYFPSTVRFRTVKNEDRVGCKRKKEKTNLNLRLVIYNLKLLF